MNIELKETLDKLGDEIIEDIGSNPCKAYKVEFPYSVKFSLTADGKRTEVLINTISEEMTFANSVRDALWQKERSDAVSKEGYIKHIVEFVSQQMFASAMDEVELYYTETATVTEMTDEELENFKIEVISGA